MHLVEYRRNQKQLMETPTTAEPVHITELNEAKKSLKEKDACIDWLDNEWLEAQRERDQYIIASRELEHKLAEQNHAVQNLHQHIGELDSSLTKLQGSWSWRVTLPFRFIGRIYRARFSG